MIIILKHINYNIDKMLIALKFQIYGISIYVHSSTIETEIRKNENIYTKRSFIFYSTCLFADKNNKRIFTLQRHK